MPRPIQILGLSGSLRRNSFNTALLRAADELLPADARLEIHPLDAVPFYDGDVEEAGIPAAVAELKARIAAADALLLACPEYNYSIAPALKNALDWATRPYGTSVLGGKPVALMGAASGLGTVRSQVHMREIVTGMGMHLMARPEVYVGGAEGKFDASFRLTDARARETIGRMLQGLVAWTRRLQHGDAALELA